MDAVGQGVGETISNEKRIYKYDLKFEENNHLYLPEGALILDIDFQAGRALKLWALVPIDERIKKTPVDILIAGTGHPIHNRALDKFDHFKTLHEEGFVWHIFLSNEYEKVSWKGGTVKARPVRN